MASPRNTNTDTVRKGFTLLEAVITVMIMGVIATVAVPRYSTAIDRYSVQAAAVRIASDLAYAREMAEAQSRNVTVTFDSDLDSYSSGDVSDPFHPGRKWRVSLADTAYVADLHSADFEGVPAVTFDFSGYPSSAGWVVVERGSEMRTVQVHAATGKAMVD